MADSAPPATACPRWLKVVLGLSLGLNLAIMGTLAGFWLRSDPPRERPTSMGYAAPYVIALPRDVRRDVFAAIRSDKTLPDRSARRIHYSDMIEVLRAEPFDRDRAEAILSLQGSEVARIQDVSQSAWLSAVANMDLSERSAYAERIEKVLSRGKHKKPRDRD